MVNLNHPPVVIGLPHEHVFAPPQALSQGGHAGIFTPVGNAGDATMNTSALNVVPNIPRVNVKSPQPISDLPLLNPDRQLNLQVSRQPVTPVKADRLEHLLTGYSPTLKQYLIDGFRRGFRIYYIGGISAFESPNLQSALQNPEVVLAKLMKELIAGRIVGPFQTAPFPVFRTSPIGIVPKKTANDFRLIHHLSYPRGSSINDSIPDDCASVHYATINDAVNILKKLGAGCYLAKTDIKSAFRIISAHPLDYPLLGIKWANQFYFDRCLAMGLKSSCAIFEKFSSSLEWLAVHHLKVSAVLHILDDFLFIAPTEDKCRTDLSNFLAMCDFLGVPIAQEKTVGPDTTLQFAGIELDSVRQEARLPLEKLTKCRTLLRQFLQQRSVVLRDLQSLIGLLNFCCSVVVPGRAFLRRLIDLTAGTTRPHHHIRLNQAAKQDIRMWLQFLDRFNGKAFFLSDRWETSVSLELYTDAAASKGYGAIFGKSWFGGPFPTAWHCFNITVLELFPIVLAVHIWGPRMANRCVMFFTDNAALVDIINKQTSRHKSVMILVRDLVLSCLSHNILFRARHVPGLLNSQADYISRFQVQRFKDITPEADELPTPVPLNLLPESWSLV